MAERGLSQRLKQRSRRAGLMIGLTMGLTIAVCAGSFAVIYAALDPLTSDFVTRSDPDRVETPAQVAAQPRAETTAAPGQNQPQQAAQTPTPPPTAPPASPPADAFTPDYQIRADSSQSINFRAGPSRQSEVIRALYPGAPLQYLNNDEPTTQASDGARWMNFRDEEGNEGWVREVDVEPYQE